MKNILSLILGKILTKNRKFALKGSDTIAKHLQISHSLYRMIECGSSSIPSHLVIKLCNLYDFDIVSLSLYHSLIMQLDFFIKRKIKIKDFTQREFAQFFLKKDNQVFDFLGFLFDSSITETKLIENIEKFLYGGLKPYLKKETAIKSFFLENPDFIKKMNDFNMVLN